MIRLRNLGLALALATPLFAQSLADSDEFRNKKSFKSAVIKDYSNMTRGDGVDWSWVRPGQRVRDFNIVIRDFKNVAGAPPRVVAELNKLNSEFTGHQKRDRATLTVETGIYKYVPKGQRGAGIGVELVYRDRRKWQIAKVRHFIKGDPVDAAEDMVDVLEEWTDDH